MRSSVGENTLFQPQAAVADILVVHACCLRDVIAKCHQEENLVLVVSATIMTFRRVVLFTSDAGIDRSTSLLPSACVLFNYKYGLKTGADQPTYSLGALEKILRLLQSLCQILASYAVGVDDAVLWIYLRKQLALGSCFLLL